ncbi:hypothetical protein [Chitinophaga defluvii]|uniref:Uncharacterized protein n=1 Tax=Chitinophaga defluvii TaxID=3163343 RepID=A0ABV2T822_9BACT
MAEEEKKIGQEQEEQPSEEYKLNMQLVSFFVKIMRTIFLGFFLMMADVFIGLFLGFAVPEESTTGRMIFFYSWFIITLTAYIYFIWRMWRKKMPVP